MWQIKKHALNKGAFERMQGTYNSHAFVSEPQTRDTHMSIGRSYRLTLYYMFLLPRKSFLIASFGTRICIHTCEFIYVCMYMHTIGLRYRRAVGSSNTTNCQWFRGKTERERGKCEHHVCRHSTCLNLGNGRQLKLKHFLSYKEEAQ